MDKEILDEITGYLRDRGLRMTPQRGVVIDSIFSTGDHFTAEELLDRVRLKDKRASRATVYRTLSLLVEGGFLKELHLGGDNKHYDPNFIEHPNHNHLVCIDCKHVVEFENEHINLLEECISRRLGFAPVNKVLRIEAHCESLKKTGVCENKSSANKPITAFSLTEVMLALTIFAFAGIGILTLVVYGVDSTADAGHKTRAALIARQIVDDLRQHDDNDTSKEPHRVLGSVLPFKTIPSFGPHILVANEHGQIIQGDFRDRYSTGVPPRVFGATYIVRVQGFQASPEKQPNLAQIVISIETPAFAPEQNREKFQYSFLRNATL